MRWYALFVKSHLVSPTQKVLLNSQSRQGAGMVEQLVVTVLERHQSQTMCLVRNVFVSGLRITVAVLLVELFFCHSELMKNSSRMRKMHAPKTMQSQNG